MLMLLMPITFKQTFIALKYDCQLVTLMMSTWFTTILIVSLLIWQLTTDKKTLSFRVTLGDQAISEQSLSLTNANNTWTAATDVDWLTG